MKLKYFSLLFSAVGIIILYILSLFSQPAYIGLNEIPNYDGKQISTEGIVTNYYRTKHGSQIITIEENNATATVFVEGAIDVEFGDRIKATGQVQKYKNDWEIIAEDLRSVKIIKKWQNISFPLWQLAERPPKYAGLNVNVTGFIETLTESSFYLVDVDEKHTLTVFFKNIDVNIKPGHKVNILGRFDFDKTNFKYFLESYEINLIKGE